MALGLTVDPTGGILSYVVKKLGDLVDNEAALIGNTGKDLEWAKKKLRILQALLNDAAAMEIRNHRMECVIEEVSEIAVSVEDAVDTLSLNLGNAKLKPRLYRFVKKIKWKRYFGAKIKELRSLLKEFKETAETVQVKLPETAKKLDESRMPAAAPCVEYEGNVDLKGRVAEVEILLDRGGSRRAVVPIVGISGIGKTTLARKIYDTLQSSFDCSAWVDASCGGNISALIRKIARDMMNLSSEDEEEIKSDDFPIKLCEFLQSKKYLIVLDDVREQTTWRQLDPVFPDGDRGSQIIITAGRAEVAPNIPPYPLPRLDEREGQILFTKNAFLGEGNPEQCFPRDLEGLRDEFVQKCRGLPIAIIVLGRLLSRKDKSIRSWSEVLQKMSWERTTDEEQCLEILKFSYISLPLHLRWCFMFLAALPEACEVSARLLTRLWIAEGFILGQDGQSLEETAEMYVEELIRRGLVHVVKRAGNGSAQVCRVHDLFLKLAILSARELRFLDVQSNNFEERQKGILRRRLSFTGDGDPGIEHFYLEKNKLRTLVIKDRNDWEPMQGQQIVAENNIQWSDFRRNLKLLRVLALGSRIKPLPEKLVFMLNLRYLELSGDKIEELPLSLGNLQQLQILDVRRTGVRSLPKSVWLIKTLRCLYGSISSTALPMPDVKPPTNLFDDLRALRSVRADTWMNNILPKLKYLKELEIHENSDENIPDYVYRTIDRLESLNVLILVHMRSSRRRITFDMGKISSRINSHNFLHTLELSEFLLVSSNIKDMPQNLRQVKFSYTRINHGLIELLGKLPSLNLLSLSAVSIVEEKITFKSPWFPKLHVLGLDNLEIGSWELESQSLPLLRELEIGRCSRLQALPERLRHIGTLKSLTLCGVPSELYERLMGENRCYVQHIERVSIYP